MNHVERFRALMNFQPVDRLPRWEWAMWWDLTIERWRREGLPASLNDVFEISQYFGLDPYKQFWFSTTDPTIEAVQHHIEGTVSNMDDYLRVRSSLYPDHSSAIAAMRPWARRQAEGEVVVWTTLEGFFWFPRTLLGFEKLMLAYYDQPELIHRINEDLLSFNLRLLEQIGRACVPTFTTIAEDMSYNHGPMVSRRICDEFLTPYYVRLLERVKEMNTIVIVDTDGDVTKLVPWLQAVGVEGVLPLERQAAVDGMELRGLYPTLRMVGHYNKLVMHLGEAAMRKEFERLVPLMRTGGFFQASITRLPRQFHSTTIVCFCDCSRSTRPSNNFDRRTAAASPGSQAHVRHRAERAIASRSPGLSVTNRDPAPQGCRRNRARSGAHWPSRFCHESSLATSRHALVPARKMSARSSCLWRSAIFPRATRLTGDGASIPRSHLLTVM